MEPSITTNYILPFVVKIFSIKGCKGISIIIYYQDLDRKIDLKLIAASSFPLHICEVFWLFFEIIWGKNWSKYKVVMYILIGHEIYDHSSHVQSLKES